MEFERWKILICSFSNVSKPPESITEIIGETCTHLVLGGVLQANLESRESIESRVTSGQSRGMLGRGKPGTFMMSFQYGGRVSEYRYRVTTQYSGSMRVTAKVSVRPGGTGHSLSNRTDIPFTPHQLSSSFLGF